MKNTNTALKIVRTNCPSKEKIVKVKSVHTTNLKENPGPVDSAAQFVRVNKEDFLSARQNLRKNASVLRTAASLLQLAGILGEAFFLVVGGLMYGYFTMALLIPEAVAIMASIGVGIAGLAFGLVCVSFGTCLNGLADTSTAEIKKLALTK